MRLWHYTIIKDLDKQRLLAQHRECCALRGKGWGKKHSVVDFIFNQPYWRLFIYHTKVMQEMQSRGFKIADDWWRPMYRGKEIKYDWSDFTKETHYKISAYYPEMNDNYYENDKKLLLQKDNNYYKIIFTGVVL